MLRHYMEVIIRFAGLCGVTGGFSSHRTVMQCFEIFFDVTLNKQMRKYPRCGDLKRSCDAMLLKTVEFL